MVGVVQGAAQVAGVSVVISAVNRFSSVFGLAQKQAKATAASFRLLAGAGIGLGLAFTAVAAKGTAMAIELETAMAGVRKTTGLAGDALKELEDAFIDLSKVVPKSAKELAEVGEIAGQLGIRGTDNIIEFTRIVSMMATATELSTEEAALALAKLSNAFSLPITDVEKLGSAINELSNISAASSSEIVNSMRRAGAAANTLGISAEVVAALSATVIASGQAAERSGTRFRRAFTEMAQKVDEFARFFGITSEEFRRRLDEDANVVLLETINRLKDMTSDSERLTQATRLFGSVGAQAINGVVTNLDDFNKLLVESNIQIEEATSLQTEFAAALDTSANQWKILGNNVAAASLEVGRSINSFLKPALQTINLTFEREEAFDKLTRAMIKNGATQEDLAMMQERVQLAILQEGTMRERQLRAITLINTELAKLNEEQEDSVVAFINSLAAAQEQNKALEDTSMIIQDLESEYKDFRNAQKQLAAEFAIGKITEEEFKNELMALNEEFPEAIKFFETLKTKIEDLNKAPVETLTEKLRKLKDQGIKLVNLSPSKVLDVESGEVRPRNVATGEVLAERPKEVGDFIIRPGQPVIETDPNDTIIGAKDMESMRRIDIGQIVINGANKNGLELAREIREHIEATG